MIMASYGRDLVPLFFNNQKRFIGFLLGVSSEVSFDRSRPEKTRATIRQHDTHTRTHSFGFCPVRHLENTIGVTCDIESSVRADNKAAQ